MLAAFVSAWSLLWRMTTADERGATSAEYALLGTLIAVVISVAVAIFGQAVNNLFTGIAGAF